MLVHLCNRLVMAAFLIPISIALDETIVEPSDRETTRFYEPFKHRPDGTLYNNGSNDIVVDSKLLTTGSFSAAFFGAVDAGKSRLIEVLARQTRSSVPKPSQWSDVASDTQKMAVHDAFTQRDDIPYNLFLIDTPGLGHRSLNGFQKAIRGIYDVQCFLERHPQAPLKRLYFVIDLASRQNADIVKNLELLKKSFGDEIASQMQIVLTKCELRSDLPPVQWQYVLDDVNSFYKQVFPDSVPPNPIMVSAKEGFGQLLEDIRRAAQCSNLPLDRNCSAWTSRVLHELNQISDSRISFGMDLILLQAEMKESESQLQQLKHKRIRIQNSIDNAENMAVGDRNGPGNVLASEWSTDQWHSALSHVESMKNPLRCGETGLDLCLLTMKVAREKPNFAEAFMRRFHELEHVIDSHDRTMKAWQLMKSDYDLYQHQPAAPSVANQKLDQARIESDIAALSDRVSRMKQYLVLKQVLQSFVGF